MRPRALAAWRTRAASALEEERCDVKKGRRLAVIQRTLSCRYIHIYILFTKDLGGRPLFPPVCYTSAAARNAPLVRQGDPSLQRPFAARMGMLRRRAPALPHAQNALARSRLRHPQLQRPDCSLRAVPLESSCHVRRLCYSGALVPHQADTSPHLTAQVSDSSPTPRERRASNSSPTPRERRPSDSSPMQRRASLSGSPMRRERRASLSGSPTRRERRTSFSGSPTRRERRTSFSSDPLEEATRMVFNPCDPMLADAPDPMQYTL